MRNELRVLLVDRKAGRSPLARVLARSECVVVGRATPSDLDRAAARGAVDVVAIDLDSPDDETLDALRALARTAPQPVAWFVEETDPHSTRAALRAGVAAFVVKGAAPERVRPVLEVAIARFHEQQAMRDALREARASHDERGLIDRAKRLLMERRNRSEPEAYRMLRTMAMQQNMRLVDVARRVLEMKEAL